jgi:hypothetical protein
MKKKKKGGQHIFSPRICLIIPVKLHSIGTCACQSTLCLGCCAASHTFWRDSEPVFVHVLDRLFSLYTYKSLFFSSFFFIQAPWCVCTRQSKNFKPDIRSNSIRYKFCNDTTSLVESLPIFARLPM